MLIKKPAFQIETASDFLKRYKINYNENSQLCKILPPYAKQLLAAINHGYKPINDIFLYFGQSAWDYAKDASRIHNVLILPPDNQPTQYNWRLVNGLAILGIDTAEEGSSGVELIEKLAFELLKNGARIVRIISASNHLVIYRQGGVL